VWHEKLIRITFIVARLGIEDVSFCLFVCLFVCFLVSPWYSFGTTTPANSTLYTDPKKKMMMKEFWSAE